MSRKVLTYKNLIIVLIVYAIILAAFFFIAAPQIRYSPMMEEATSISGVVGGVYDGRTISQRFTFKGKYIQKISLMSGTYNRENAGEEVFRLKTSSVNVIWEKAILEHG